MEAYGALMAIFIAFMMAKTTIKTGDAVEIGIALLIIGLILNVNFAG
jgi:hypothetical protein